LGKGPEDHVHTHHHDEPHDHGHGEEEPHVHGPNCKH
jgi:hypothetical protein